MTRTCLGRIPLPKGEGAAQRRVRGTTRKIVSFGTPHPVLRTTLALRERDSIQKLRNGE
jgi:hypothetical protein